MPTVAKLNAVRANKFQIGPGAEPTISAFSLAGIAAGLSLKHDKHDRACVTSRNRGTLRHHRSMMAEIKAGMDELKEAIFRAPLRDGTDVGALAVTEFTSADVALSAVLDIDALRAVVKQMRASFARIACFSADDAEFNLDGLLPGEEALVRGYAA